MSRNKGRRGEAEASILLKERDYEVIQTSSGMKHEDIVAIDSNNKKWSVEVKNHKLIKLADFKKQAKEQAKNRKMSYMLMIRLERESAWLVMREGERVTLWFSKDECSE